MRRNIEVPFKADLDEMAKRRAIRVGVTFNRTHYFIDGGQERGLTYEALKSFEKDLNERFKTGTLKIHVIPVPMSRDQLSPALAGGKVDMVAAMVTVRPELEKLAAFSDPTRTGVNQVVVTGPGAPALASIDDLAGREVFVRKASAYHETLTGVSAQLQGTRQGADRHPRCAGRARGRRHPRNGQRWPDADHRRRRLSGKFWEQVFTQITVRPDLAVRTGGNLAVAFRKENPQLRATVNQWLASHGKGDTFRAVVEQRYLKNLKYAKNATADAERQKFQEVLECYKTYGAQYDIDYLLMAAQGYGIDAGPRCEEPRRRHWCDAGDGSDRQATRCRRHP